MTSPVPNRTPRFVFLGRRGAGKTTLLTALLRMQIGQISAVSPEQCDMRWGTYQTPDGGQIEVLDTRGFQASGDGKHSKTMGAVAKALRGKTVDAFVFLIKAKEVDAAVDGDISALAEIVRIAKKAQKAVSVVAALTQCDELDPPYINLARDRDNHPQEWEEKLNNVRAAVEQMSRMFERRADIWPFITHIVPTAAFVRIREDGTIDPDPRLDHRWNLDRLSEALLKNAHRGQG